MEFFSSVFKKIASSYIMALSAFLTSSILLAIQNYFPDSQYSLPKRGISIALVTFIFSGILLSIWAIRKAILALKRTISRIRMERNAKLENLTDAEIRVISIMCNSSMSIFLFDMKYYSTSDISSTELKRACYSLADKGLMEPINQSNINISLTEAGIKIAAEINLIVREREQAHREQYIDLQ
ncbi:hypothetical protein [Vibrio parahaemolyticus]|uniref:hypothetical protein n=1 Tax=Vibrio parahaemolyticus TaxID=670 RepID=UPI00226BBBFD|nr:hypothetical protein [Vibrio parahaemolyticus]MCX8941243.1 hypothetical protein [Vibrio parahaemolyticus]